MADSEKKVYPVRMTVTEAHPTCAAGHKVGDEWIWEDTTPPGICSSVFACSFNAYLGLRFGGKEPEAEMVLQSRPGEHGPEGYTNEAMTTIYRRCPDPNKRVVIALERIVDDLDAEDSNPSKDKSE